ncbi:AzlD domain-containing protein [Mycobacterium sp. E3198]|uniref:AzlD domain-containing protein n=1 Tax=Mycobacterium sp. E3198 TaxID=1834143 RepID=UPI0008022382|nr:AzlD domain-containing protein [Mycobacterium sp. E3198]OBG29750.1 hypothetical protein A5673_01295 [Mycobacterium sp. E3198]
MALWLTFTDQHWARTFRDFILARLHSQRAYRDVINVASIGFVAALGCALVITSTRRVHVLFAHLPHAVAPRRGALRLLSLLPVAIIVAIVHSAIQVYKTSPDDDGVYYSISNIILSAAATVMAAFGVWFILELISGFFVYRALCVHQARALDKAGNEPKDNNIPEARRRGQAKAVRWRLDSADWIVLSAQTIDAGNSFVKDLANEFNRHKVITLTLDRPAYDGTYSTAVRAEFRALLRKADVAPHPFLRGAESYARAFEQLTRFRRIVVVIKNMEAITRIGSPQSTRQAVADSLDELRSAGIHFVAIVTQAAFPSQLFAESLALAPPDNLELENIGPTGNEKDRKRRERAVRRLGNVLQPTGLRVPTVYHKNHDIARIEETAKALKRDGLIRFACDHIDTFFHADAGVARLERLVVDGLADRLILSGGWAVEISDIYRDLANSSRFDVKRTVAALCKRGLLSEDHSATTATIRFMDPRLGEIAIGSRLAQAAVPFSLSVDRSALCTAAEIYTRMSAAAFAVAVAEENVPKVWRRAIAELSSIAELSDDECPIKQSALAAAGGALNAASSLKYVVSLEQNSLDTVWEKADSATQKAFADRLTARTVGTVPGVPKALWHLATYAADWRPERHIVNRALCRRVGSGGAATWDALLADWASIVRSGHESRAGLSWRYRWRGDWHGHEFALIAWILPTLLVSASSRRADVHLAVKDLADAIAPYGPSPDTTPHDGSPQAAPPDGAVAAASPASSEAAAKSLRRRDASSAPHAAAAGPDQAAHGGTDDSRRDPVPDHDVGMQIALAEGCRDASYLCLTDSVAAPDELVEVTGAILGLHWNGPRTHVDYNDRSPLRGASWYARLVALQALLVACAADRDRRAEFDECVAEPDTSTPFLDRGLEVCREDPHQIVKEYAGIVAAKQTLLGSDPHIFVSKFVWLDDNTAVSQAGGELDPQVLRILAQVMMLLNFSGASEWLDEYHPAGRIAEWGLGRANGLARDDLPRCVTHWWASHRVMTRCPGRAGRLGCDFDMCRQGVYDAPKRRKLSDTFVERCLDDSGAIGQRWRLRAVRTHLLELSRSLPDR